jgi:ABC-type xylose transport system permease subunit
MAQLSPRQLIFIAVNAAIGALVGLASVQGYLPGQLRLPTFVWLVLGMLAVELLAGLALKMHPSALVTMPARFAALAVSFIACYAIIGLRA